MTTKEFFLSAWHWNLWILGGSIVFMLLYGFRGPARSFHKMSWLLAGLGVFCLTFISPMAVLADGYLFSAHMAQHLLLLLVVPAFILKSLPIKHSPSHTPSNYWAPLDWMLRHPLVTWLLGVGGMWLWHLPALCAAAVTDEWVRTVQFISLLGMGFAFWWPIIGPRRDQWLPPLTGIVYLSSACLGCTILGIILTFAPGEICAAYLHPVDRLGILPLIRNQWGLTPARDEQLGGLLMWVPACLIYFCGICGLLARWYGENDSDTQIATVPFNSAFIKQSDDH